MCGVDPGHGKPKQHVHDARRKWFLGSGFIAVSKTLRALILVQIVTAKILSACRDGGGNACGLQTRRRKRFPNG